MSGSVYGNIFKISTWGESHGKALGVTIDGCPAGVEISEKDIQIDLDRRKPGSTKYSTQRKETDNVEILSGVFDGKTTGTPISLIIYNKDQRSKDYSDICNVYRPGHADYCFETKYGIRDYRGGGRSSGRETVSRVAAGAVARKILQQLGIDVCAYTISIGEISINQSNFDKAEIHNNPFAMPDKTAAKDAADFLDNTVKKQDSAGGIIQCDITGIKAGIGEPVFDKLDASLAKAIFSIGAIKGIEFGLGFESAKTYGSFNNDEFFINNENKIIKYTNHSGGILGGMSDGSQITFRTAVKPTPSISKTQKTVTNKFENVEININGRHDPVIVPRAVIVVEAMTAITLVDYIFLNMASRIDRIVEFYKSI